MDRKHNPFENPVVAQEWIDFVRKEKSTSRSVPEINKVVAEWCQNPKLQKVLDLGSGEGRMSELIKHSDYYAVEPSPTLVAQIERRGKKVIRGVAEEIPFEKNIFDGVLLVNVLLHIKEPAQVFQEMARVLKCDGTFLVINPNPNTYYYWLNFYLKNNTYEPGLVKGTFNSNNLHLSEHIFYFHKIDSILKAMELNNLKVNVQKEIVDKNGIKLYCVWEGLKNG